MPFVFIVFRVSKNQHTSSCCWPCLVLLPERYWSRYVIHVWLDVHNVSNVSWKSSTMHELYVHMSCSTTLADLSACAISFWTISKKFVGGLFITIGCTQVIVDHILSKNIRGTDDHLYCFKVLPLWNKNHRQIDRDVRVLIWWNGVLLGCIDLGTYTT